MAISGRAMLGLCVALCGCSSAEGGALYGNGPDGVGSVPAAVEADSGPVLGAGGAQAGTGGRFGLAVEDSGAPRAGGGATSAGGVPGSGGARATGGAVSTGGVAGSGGAPRATGGASTGGVDAAGGVPAAGGGNGSGGSISSGGAVGSGGAPVCDPAIQCEAHRCFGLVACGNGATLDCSLVVHCGKTEYCDKNNVAGTCRSFFDGLECNGAGSGPIHVCAVSGATGACNDCQRAPTASECKPTSAPDSWRCTAG